MRPQSSAADWFFRTLAALLAVVVVGGIVVFFMLGGTALWLRETTTRDQEATQSLHRRAKAAALLRLREFGIRSLAEDGQAVRRGNEVIYRGLGMDSASRLKPVFVRFRVGKFGTREVWEPDGISIDGQFVYLGGEHVGP